MEPTNKGDSPSPPGDKRAHHFGYLKDLVNCPPSTSVGREGTFYAFHDSDPPDAADFQTAEQRGSHLDGDPCQRRSNSIWSDLEALERKVAQLRRRHSLRYRFISAGDIRKDHGVIDDGKGPHHSFWVSETTSMHAIFNRRVQ